MKKTNLDSRPKTPGDIDNTIHEILDEEAFRREFGAYSDTNFPIYSPTAPVISFSEVIAIMQKISSARQQMDLIPPFYKNVTQYEFGVSRFLADRMNHLWSLLHKAVIEELVPNDHYLISSEVKDSSGSSIKLEHWFRSSSSEEAAKVAKVIISQLAGIQQKIWLACWKLGNNKRSLTFTCGLTDLMKISQPGYTASFSTTEKVEFYGHLRSLEHTKLIFSKVYSSKGGKQSHRRFELPLLQISHSIFTEGSSYPRELTLTIMNFPETPQEKKMAHLGAPFKNETFTLSPKDMSLARYIQVRKSQAQNRDFIDANLTFLLREAGLEKTAKTNLSHAKRLLKKKLSRLVEAKILKSVPSQLDDKIFLITR